MAGDLRGDRPETQPAEAACPAGTDDHQGRMGGEFDDGTGRAASDERGSDMHGGMAGVGPQLGPDQRLLAGCPCRHGPLGTNETRKRHMHTMNEQERAATARRLPCAQAGRLLAARAAVNTHQDRVPVDAVRMA